MRRRRQSIQSARPKPKLPPKPDPQEAEDPPCRQHDMVDCSICHHMMLRKRMSGEAYLALTKDQQHMVHDSIAPTLTMYIFEGRGYTYRKKGYTPDDALLRMGNEVYNLGRQEDLMTCTDPDGTEVIYEFHADGIFTFHGDEEGDPEGERVI